MGVPSGAALRAPFERSLLFRVLTLGLIVGRSAPGGGQILPGRIGLLDQPIFRRRVQPFSCFSLSIASCASPAASTCTSRASRGGRRSGRDQRPGGARHAADQVVRDADEELARVAGEDVDVEHAPHAGYCAGGRNPASTVAGAPFTRAGAPSGGARGPHGAVAAPRDPGGADEGAELHDRLVERPGRRAAPARADRGTGRPQGAVRAPTGERAGGRRAG